MICNAQMIARVFETAVCADQASSPVTWTPSDTTLHFCPSVICDHQGQDYGTVRPSLGQPVDEAYCYRGAHHASCNALDHVRCALLISTILGHATTYPSQRTPSSKSARSTRRFVSCQAALHLQRDRQFWTCKEKLEGFAPCSVGF